MESLHWLFKSPGALPTMYIAPTWSWASSTAPIQYNSWDVNDMELMAEVVDIECTPAGVDRCGRVSSGYIVECSSRTSRFWCKEAAMLLQRCSQQEDTFKGIGLFWNYFPATFHGANKSFTQVFPVSRSKRYVSSDQALEFLKLCSGQCQKTCASRLRVRTFEGR